MISVAVGDVNMAWLLMNDEIDFPSTWYPTHIISRDNTLINVFIGASQSLLGGFGIWIDNDDYDHIRHDKAYIFIHNPDATDDDIESIDWDKIPDVDESEHKTTNRKHIHLCKEMDFEEVNGIELMEVEEEDE